MGGTGIYMNGQIVQQGGIQNTSQSSDCFRGSHGGHHFKHHHRHNHHGRHHGGR
jgi:hypothetical protein